jgi:membrane-associated phospholipid phosphatase
VADHRYHHAAAAAGPPVAAQAVSAADVTSPSPAAESAVVPGVPHVTPTPAPVSRRTAMAVSAAAAVALAALAIWVAGHGSAVPAVDQDLHRWALDHRDRASIAVARAIRWGGVTWVVFPALIVVGAAAAGAGSSARRRAGAGLLLCLLASAGGYAETQLNHLVARARPPVADWAGGAAGMSFPSGHTTAATLAALTAAWALAARARPGWPRRALWTGTAVWAAAVGWSRVWLGVHWPTDVVAGWLAGLAWFGAAVAVTLSARRPPAGARAAGAE